MRNANTSYAPSLEKVIRLKGSNCSGICEENPCTSYRRKNRSKKRSEPKKLNLSKWIADLCDWLNESGGIRTREEAIARAKQEGITITQFKARIAGHTWLRWEGGARTQTLRIVPLEEIQQEEANEEFHEKASEQFGRTPHTAGKWIPVEEITKGDLIWGTYPLNKEDLYTDHRQAKQDGTPPQSGKFIPIIVEGRVYKRQKRTL